MVRPASGLMGRASRGALPPPALCGFLVLLLLMFAAAYAVGVSVGPVAPGMHGSRTYDGGGHDAGDTDMGGMDMGHGSGH